MQIRININIRQEQKLDGRKTYCIEGI